jgi:hypothetical protein
MTKSIEENWWILTSLTETALAQSTEIGLAEKYLAMLEDLESDRTINGKLMIGMKRAPGSKNRHHCVEGGLVAHLLQMWTLWRGLRTIISPLAELHALMSDTNIWRAILHHDLNKVRKYALTSIDPWTVEYVKNEDVMSEMLGSPHKVLQILNRHGIRLNIPLHNALITAEGGYSESRPAVDTVLAKIVYLLDELSANVVDRLQTNRFWDSKLGGISEVP